MRCHLLIWLHLPSITPLLCLAWKWKSQRWVFFNVFTVHVYICTLGHVSSAFKTCMTYLWSQVNTPGGEQPLTQYAWPLHNPQGQLLRRGQQKSDNTGNEYVKIWIGVESQMLEFGEEFVFSLVIFSEPDMGYSTWLHSVLSSWPPLLIET